ncbi:hypothetical protein ACFRCW_44010 [Streptomyces sp. NPDC056653]|uniref:hypothetical protein n=1 Tax=Streptomyces sp. NPDC056653 TaxID=3345894 RepID=UPI00369E0C48
MRNATTQFAALSRAWRAGSARVSRSRLEEPSACGTRTAASRSSNSRPVSPSSVLDSTAPAYKGLGQTYVDDPGVVIEDAEARTQTNFCPIWHKLSVFETLPPAIQMSYTMVSH